MIVAGERFVVLGVGVSGVEASKLLRARGAEVTARDSGSGAKLDARAAELRALGVTVETGEGIGTSTDFTAAILSPGIDPEKAMVKTVAQAGVAMIGEMELAARLCPQPLIAITGTNGKTTTTELCSAVLNAAGQRNEACGNIGKPFTQVVHEAAPLDAIVLEVSSFQLETIRDFRPSIAVYLNLTPDHLDRYPTMKEYQAAKWRLFENMTADDVAVVNSAAALPPMKARQVTINAFGGSADYTYSGGWLHARGEKVLALSETNLVGPHNAENLLAVLAVADERGIARAVTLETFRTYRARPHRCERVAEIDGVIYYNDSKATNIDAMEKALVGMPSAVVLIAGGKDKGLDFSGLTSLVRAKAKDVVLIGQMTDKLEALWQGKVPCHRAATLDDAVAKAKSLAVAGDSVLFSPGCSSFDMFRDYEDRGDQFRQAVLLRKQQ